MRKHLLETRTAFHLNTSSSSTATTLSPNRTSSLIGQLLLICTTSGESLKGESRTKPNSPDGATISMLVERLARPLRLGADESSSFPSSFSGGDGGLGTRPSEYRLLARERLRARRLGGGGGGYCLTFAATADALVESPLRKGTILGGGGAG